MAQILQKQVDKGVKLGVWEITESLSELERNWAIVRGQREDGLSLEEIGSSRRRKELLASRLLLDTMDSRLHESISYDPWGKPHLSDGSFKISISHCRSHAAILLHNMSDCGIDIEIISPRILPLASKFTSKKEEAYIADSRRLEQIQMIWSAKEVVYKIKGRHGLLFKEDIYVHPFEPAASGHLDVTLKKNNVICEYQLYYQNDGNIIIVYGWQDDSRCRPSM